MSDDPKPRLVLDRICISSDVVKANTSQSDQNNAATGESANVDKEKPAENLTVDKSEIKKGTVQHPQNKNQTQESTKSKVTPPEKCPKSGSQTPKSTRPSFSSKKNVRHWRSGENQTLWCQNQPPWGQNQSQWGQNQSPWGQNQNWCSQNPNGWGQNQSAHFPFNNRWNQPFTDYQPNHETVTSQSQLLAGRNVWNRINSRNPKNIWKQSLDKFKKKRTNFNGQNPPKKALKVSPTNVSNKSKNNEFHFGKNAGVSNQAKPSDSEMQKRTDESNVEVQNPTDESNVAVQNPTDQSNALVQNPTDQSNAEVQNPTSKTNASNENQTHQSKASIQKPICKTQLDKTQSPSSTLSSSEIEQELNKSIQTKCNPTQSNSQFLESSEDIIREQLKQTTNENEILSSINLYLLGKVKMQENKDTKQSSQIETSASVASCENQQSKLLEAKISEFLEQSVIDRDASKETIANLKADLWRLNLLIKQKQSKFISVRDKLKIEISSLKAEVKTLTEFGKMKEVSLRQKDEQILSKNFRLDKNLEKVKNLESQLKNLSETNETLVTNNRNLTDQIHRSKILIANLNQTITELRQLETVRESKTKKINIDVEDAGDQNEQNAKKSKLEQIERLGNQSNESTTVAVAQVEKLQTGKRKTSVVSNSIESNQKAEEADEFGNDEGGSGNSDKIPEPKKSRFELTEKKSLVEKKQSSILNGSASTSCAQNSKLVEKLQSDQEAVSPTSNLTESGPKLDNIQADDVIVGQRNKKVKFEQIAEQSSSLEENPSSTTNESASTSGTQNNAKQTEKFQIIKNAISTQSDSAESGPKDECANEMSSNQGDSRQLVEIKEIRQLVKSLKSDIGNLRKKLEKDESKVEKDPIVIQID